MALSIISRGTGSAYASGFTSKVYGCYTVVGTAGTQQTVCWTVPAGVNSISVIMVGGGGVGAGCSTNSGGGGGGALLAVNNFKVLAGSTMQLKVGGGATPSTSPYN